MSLELQSRSGSGKGKRVGRGPLLAVVAAMVFGFAGLLMPQPLLWARSNFTDLPFEKIHPGTGTMEFRVKLINDISSDPHNHVLLLGVSSDGLENYSIEIIQDQLIARRFFGSCLLAVFSHPYRFDLGQWHGIKMTWNKETTRFYVDDREVKGIGLRATDDIPKMVPGVRIGREKNFVIERYKSSDQTDVYALPADRTYAENIACPNLKQRLEGNPQELYRDTALRHFPDQVSRNTVRSYLALLPENFEKTIRNVVYVEDSRFSARGEAGLADETTGSIFLKGSFYADPTVFFHEAAHLYDYQQKINFGVADERSEWAAISGVNCYFKGAKLDEFWVEFQKTKDQNAILNPQGGQCAFEDLAIWVGAVYDAYLKHKSLADRLDPGKPKYSEKAKKKLDFLLKKGFFSREIYEKISH